MKSNSKTQKTLHRGGDYGLHSGLISPEALHVVKTLQKHGYDAVIVGGAVRDLLLRKTPKDFDVATNASPNAVKKLFRRSYIVGRRFRIVQVNLGNNKATIEVTTYRSGDNSTVNEEGRIVRDNEFGDQETDSSRRDFSCNAMFYDPAIDTIIDYHDGLRSILERRLVSIGDPMVRFREDPVRILRAIRLSAKLGLRRDDDVQRAIVELLPLVANEPEARMQEEFYKIMMSGHSLECFETLLSLPDVGRVHPLLQNLSAASEAEWGLVRDILGHSDERWESGNDVSTTFIIAGMYWNVIKNQWNRNLRTDFRIRQALFRAIDQIGDSIIPKWPFSKKILERSKFIWRNQANFHKLDGEFPLRFAATQFFHLSHLLFKYRAEAGEVNRELSNWWDEFLDMSHEERKDECAAHYKANPDFAEKGIRKIPPSRRANSNKLDLNALISEINRQVE